jgi:hypothetical protein
MEALRQAWRRARTSTLAAAGALLVLLFFVNARYGGSDGPYLREAWYAQGSAAGSLRLVANGSLPSGQPLRVFPKCDAVMGKLRDMRGATTWPPPCPLPAALAPAFAAHGLPLTNPDACFAQRYDGGSSVDWTEADLEAKAAALRARTWCGSYSCADVDSLDSTLAWRSGDVAGKRGLVIGSEQPWVELLALDAGAAEMWTMEYGDLRSTHPRVHTAPYTSMAADFLAGSMAPFDFLVTYSSIEHSGLGRYGGEGAVWAGAGDRGELKGPLQQ